jgi:hypothetical protein
MENWHANLAWALKFKTFPCLEKVSNLKNNELWNCYFYIKNKRKLKRKHLVSFCALSTTVVAQVFVLPVQFSDIEKSIIFSELMREKLSNTNLLKRNKFIKGIVSRDWWGLQKVLFHRFEVQIISGSPLFIFLKL